MQAIKSFLEECNIDQPFDIKQIKTGRNSRVWKISNTEDSWILKSYPKKDKADNRDRLKVEYNFLKLLQDGDIDRTPRPVKFDNNSSLALYSFIPGHRPTIITNKHIKQLTNFINLINKLSPIAKQQPINNASDACFSYHDHINLTKKRIDLLTSSKVSSDIESEMQRFIKNSIQPRWNYFNNAIIQQIKREHYEQSIIPRKSFLSPSDFGFHNTLEHKNKLSFIDFEYAGWDDPAKLICDFICQPEIPVSKQQSLQFTNEITSNLIEADNIKLRVNSLLPIHRLKWCCIILNEFYPAHKDRRLHAGIEEKNLLTKQLRKAQQYFKTHL